ncbi:hypothetical protein vBOeSunk162_43 [Oenococcus phage vB_OeS_unk162]|nr:hypothetical protein vBOeSunk162_43 [Oenococcus phage vB_OeS_unk162]
MDKLFDELVKYDITSLSVNYSQNPAYNNGGEPIPQIDSFQFSTVSGSDISIQYSKQDIENVKIIIDTICKRIKKDGDTL